jgi:hypothetical protein
MVGTYTTSTGPQQELNSIFRLNLRSKTGKEKIKIKKGDYFRESE